MSNRWLRSSVWISIPAMVLSGCHSGAIEEYPTWIAEPKAYAPRQDSTNAFDAFALAAVDAEQKGGASIDRVSFYPGQKKEAESALRGPVERVIAAAKYSCDFQFVAHKPFQPVPYQRGWRLIGRIILWDVEDSCRAAEFDKAISLAVSGTRFGFGLTGGGATDASLGLSISDDLRKAIAPYMSKMSAVQLDKLGKGFKEALAAKPPISFAIRHERENTLRMIQYLQDSVRSGQLKTVQTNLGPDVNEAIRYLDGISGNTSKRRAYFDSLAKAAEEEIAVVEQDSQIPASTRKRQRMKIDAAWKKLAKHVYGSARPLLDINDATVARTRLLILYAETARIGRANKPYPINLNGFTPELTIDPYSGSPFIYHADAAEFSIYSVGSNGQDDGGDTDASFTKPDLRLELPSQ